MEVLAFEGQDVLYGFLPPFHSFGFTVTTTLPMVSGLKCAFFPNPNESRRIAYGCARWRVSIMAGTPTFLRGILNAAPGKVFETLRVLVSGAEKAPPELFSQVAQLGHNAQLLEGYGITECSPVVSVGRLNEPHLGVGRPLRDVEILVVNPQDLRPRDRGESGLILISGPNVFPGYLGDAPSPFVEVDGKRWYNSGDIGFMQEQNLVIAGRLKRFIKIAGEMISLPAIEEALSTHWPSSGSEPVLAVHAQEPADGSRPAIFLFTTLQIDRSEANQVLKDTGLPALARIGKVLQIETMPLLGSGKVDLRALAQMASSAAS